MPQPPIWDPLWGYLETDVGFYFAIGIATILVFICSLAVVMMISPVSIGGGGLLGLLVGFGLFMAVFFVAIAALGLENEQT